MNGRGYWRAVNQLAMVWYVSQRLCLAKMVCSLLEAGAKMVLQPCLSASLLLSFPFTLK